MTKNGGSRCRERSLSGSMNVGNLSKEFFHRLRGNLADNFGNKYQALERFDRCLMRETGL